MQEAESPVLPVVEEASEAVWEAVSGGQPILLTRGGQPAAVVVDTGTGGIWSVSLTSKAKKLVASLKPGLDNLAFDSRGRLFVSSMTDNGIYLVDKVTGSSKTIVEGRLAIPTDISPDGELHPRSHEWTDLNLAGTARSTGWRRRTQPTADQCIGAFLALDNNNRI